MGKHDKRPKKDDINLTAQMNVAPATEMTGALPAQLTPEQQAEVFDQVFGMKDSKPHDEKRK